MLQVKSPAPHFETGALVGKEFKTVKLTDYLSKDKKKGKWVVLFFYPLDFTFVCPTEIKGFAAEYAEFKKRGAEVIGCSIDSKNCQVLGQGDGWKSIRHCRRSGNGAITVLRAGRPLA